MIPTAQGAPQETPDTPAPSTALDPVVVEITRLAVNAVLDSKGETVRILDVTGRTSICDALVLVTGSHARHVNGIADAVVRNWRADRGTPPLGVEGTETGRWVLIDLGDVIVHVFDGPMRGYYDLDGLWMDARSVSLKELDIDHVEDEGPQDDDSGFDLD